MFNRRRRSVSDVASDQEEGRGDGSFFSFIGRLLQVKGRTESGNFVIENNNGQQFEVDGSHSAYDDKQDGDRYEE